jgi:hypothetical protein
MKLALILTIYKRPDLEEIVIKNFVKQSKKFGFEIIVVGSEGNFSKRLADGCHYVESDNFPLSFKHQKGLDYAKELGFDGVVVFGSDDICCDNYWKWVYSLGNIDSLAGLKDFYFYSTEKKQLYYFKGYESEMSLGAGRYYSKAVLDLVGWNLWGSEERNKALDSLALKQLKDKGINEILIKQKEYNMMVIDVKHTRNITNHSFLDNCEKVNFMAKKKKELPMQEIEALKQPEIVNVDLSAIDDKKTYTFIANGKSKHLVNGESYEIKGDMLKIFIKQGYGVIG